MATLRPLMEIIITDSMAKVQVKITLQGSRICMDLGLELELDKIDKIKYQNIFTEYLEVNRMIIF